MTVEDIEDLPLLNVEHTVKSPSVQFKVKEQQVVPELEEEEHKGCDCSSPGECSMPTEGASLLISDPFAQRPAGEVDHLLPGNYSIAIRTWGCSHNSSDSEYMGGILASHGYRVILVDSNNRSEEETASLLILNSCTVKNPSEQTFINHIEAAQKRGQKVILAGCVPQGQKGSKASPFIGANYSIMGTQQIDRIVEIVEETLKGNSIQFLETTKDPQTGRKTGGNRLDLPKIRRNKFVEIIPINTGCLNHCTYCKTKHARGTLGSYEPAEIVERVSSVFSPSEGVVKVLLTSEDTGAYGRDIGLALPDLLEQLVDHIPEHGRIRLGMTNPPYILEHLEEIARFLNHPRVFKFLHIPVQAGSDRVLYDMRREYNAFEFRRVVDYLRSHVPGITIATDIICGFPTETEEDFEETLQLVRDYKFPVLHISQFYPRPGTPAARLARLPTEVVKARSRQMTQLFESYNTFEGMEGRVFECLVTEFSTDGKHYVGHNEFYHQVLIPLPENFEGDLRLDESEFPLLGKLVRVKITKAGKYYLMGMPEVAEEAEDDPLTKQLLNANFKTARSNSAGLRSTTAGAKKNSTKTLLEMKKQQIMSRSDQLSGPVLWLILGTVFLGQSIQGYALISYFADDWLSFKNRLRFSLLSALLLAFIVRKVLQRQ